MSTSADSVAVRRPQRFSRRYSTSPAWRIANVVAALVAVGVLVVAAPFVLAILSVVGFWTTQVVPALIPPEMVMASPLK
ncbi:hypothetical protein [Nocardia sp. NPDC004604]|uniref:hypothetical protein n=1 Tax=Nocardia sp. NPDC004604 TaxID=3157013 RepID=UPI0033ADACFF